MPVPGGFDGVKYRKDKKRKTADERQKHGALSHPTLQHPFSLSAEIKTLDETQTFGNQRLT
jgi:hypothetical protein